uniref:Uncharacterized protein n=1 Tax=Grammatophora oceanica TaxID=210454 RepID=A0A7S1VK33_9STRA|eukprot:CAMPEP_0194027438 /NCGR_PEP_ID=MMETSP0009_2-20130614/1588_1 /TAXON_ID=210454 /ORGANISM="Grammatophora oceanica, Strain CCMP 410" /LENGTH=236 /DNA_ID=CAMNT_0038666499 /DNA_START=25 /DNA_END=735 /DNA_ORIENTATION=+
MKFASFFSLLALSTPTWARMGGCPNGSEKVVINFDRLPDGTPTAAGEMVYDQWKEYGVIFSGRRKSHEGERFVNKEALRLFDSSHPTGGDFNLGSPNEKCHPCKHSSGPCPGVGESGKPSNCANQNKVLIIDQKGMDHKDPDAAEWGGEIIATFTVAPRKILGFSVMDVVAHTDSYWEILTPSGHQKETGPLPETGENGFAVANLNFQHGNIGSIRFEVDQEFALTHLRFCMPIEH